MFSNNKDYFSTILAMGINQTAERYKYNHSTCTDLLSIIVMVREPLLSTCVDESHADHGSLTDLELT